MIDQRLVKCLVVDDDHDAADVVGHFLKIMGGDVRIAYGGQEAVDIASHYEPRVVVLDINMPAMDGYETCRILRQQGWSRDAVFIAYTGTPTPQAAAVAAGFDRVVSKGDSPIVFETILKGLLSGGGTTPRPTGE